MKNTTNEFEKYSSKIDRIDIELPNFKYFHGASSEEKVDPKFIGRKKIINQLKSWIIDKNSKTGVYLITGFRGMGKSSFVGKALNNISNKPSKRLKYYCYVIISIIIISCFIFSLHLFKINGYNFNNYIDTIIKLKTEYYLIFYCLLFFLNLLFKGYIDRRNKDCSYYRIPIKLNLGHETLDERDILSLISKNIEYKFKEFRTDIWINFNRTYFKTFIISFSSSFISLFFILNLFPSINTAYKSNAGYLPKLMSYINDITYYSVQSMGHLSSLFISLFSYASAFILVYYLWKFAMRILNTRKPSAGMLEREMHTLNGRIASSINEDEGPSGGFGTSILGISINNKRRRNYPLANAREIEIELSNILNRVDELKNSPKFIIVFDELDKIDPLSNHDLKKESDGVPEFEHVGSGFPGGATSRKRKQNLLKLLANMKYFISTAKAKFIFIAGRELYDAFLADVSDREFSIGSIFNNVIYVDSFLDSKHDHKDITSMTEEFICKQLFPNNLPKDFRKDNNIKKNEESHLDLKHYSKYLDYLIKKDSALDLNENAKEKIIIFLYHFALYLAHISNGAPKKIAIHFEKYIKSRNDIQEESKIIPSFSKKRCENYLSFGYLDQRKIGFIHYMAFPLVNAIFNNASQYGDKLLVSACFLTNHIYKYHNNGFSWRNLENIPELLEVNRTPELREFINIIITFLRQSHLSSITSGLYNFKFPMRISEEISLMSRFSEEISALLNFTLDDSLSVKRHYTRLLKFYTSENKENNRILSGIHHILGDLHLLDEEYNEAIFEYQSGVQLLINERIENNDSHNTSQILSTTRIMLKLGLTHEKRKTYNNAYTIYNELISKLVKFRYIDESELDLEYIQEINSEPDWQDRTDILYKPTYREVRTTSSFEKQIRPKILNKFNSKDIQYVVTGKDLIPQLAQQLTPEKNTLIIRLSMFENIRLIYQALLAKVFVLEKKEMSGITKETLDIMESEFRFLHRSVYYKERYMIAADFFKKVGDILYYKNGLINKESYSLFMGLYFWDYDVEKEIYDYLARHTYNDYEVLNKIKNATCETINSNYIINFGEEKIIKDFISKPEYFKLKKHILLKDDNINDISISEHKIEISGTNSVLKKIIFCNDRRKSLFTGSSRQIGINNEVKNKRIPCYACKYYTRSLKILIKNLISSDKSEHPISKALFFLSILGTKDEFNSLRENDLIILSSTLDGMGNVLFSCSSLEDNITEDFLQRFFNFINLGYKDPNNKIWNDKISLSPIEKSILYYWTAASYYKYASSLKDAFLCYKKVMQLFVAYIEINAKKSDKIQIICNQLDNIRDVIFNRAIQNLYSHYENTNMVEIQKLKWLFSKEMYQEIPLDFLSLFPDIEELILTYHELELKCNIITNIPKIYNSKSLSKHRIESTISERIISLRFKAMLNMKILNKLLSYETYFYNKYFPYIFYKKYCQFLFGYKKTSAVTIGDQLDEFAHCFDESITSSNVNTKKIQLIEFLIKDIMFSLSKIIETIPPLAKTSLFSDSYMGGIYQMLFECNQIYELVYMMYKFVECKNDSEKSLIRERLNNIANSRNNNNNYRVSVPTLDFLNIEMNEKAIKDLVIWSDQKNECSYSESFFNQIKQSIDKANIHINASNYLAEMALKKYRKAREMHREGAAYKEMVSNMHFLDDDLNNDTCQFYFAIERYYNNCGIIDDQIRNLETICKNSSLLKMDSYAK